MIRVASHGDLDALLQLNAVVQGWHARHYPNRFKAEVDPDAMRDFFRERLAEDGCHILIERRGTGYLFARKHAARDTAYGRQPAELHIEHIAVLPAHQGEGIGRALLRSAEDLARDLGCEALTLDTWAENREAHAMFEAFGLAPLRHHYAKPLD